MLAGLATVAALSLVVWSVWARILHSDRWGSQIIAVIFLTGVSLVFLGPNSVRLNALPGLAEALGYFAFVIAAVVFLSATLSRLGTEEIFRKKVHQLIELPALVAVPAFILLYLAAHLGVSTWPFSASEWARIESVAWLLTILYLQVCIWSALRVLVRHPKHRRVATICLVICAGVIASAIAKMVTVVMGWPPSIGDQVLWATSTMTVTLFVVTTIRRVVAHPRVPEGRRYEDFDSSPSTSE